MRPLRSWGCLSGWVAAPRQRRGASGAAFPRGAWEQSDVRAQEIPAPGLASSRLKPVPLTAARAVSGTDDDPVGPASAGKLLICFKAPLIFLRKKSRHRQSRLGCRLNAGLAEWAEPHGCGESAVRTWMSVRRGPTERDRSEGTLTKEGPNQEHKPLVTWGFIK